MSTHIPKPPPTTTTQADGGRPRRRWWRLLFGLIAALAISLLVAVAILVAIVVVSPMVAPLLQPACTTAAHPERTGAISYYCPSGYQPGSSMTIGADGNVWFADNNGKIARMTPQNKAVTEFAAPTPPNQVAGNGLVRGADGNIWYVANDTFGRITMSGQISTFALPKDLGLARGIAAGSAGPLWVSMSLDPGQTGALLKISIPSDTTQTPHITQVPLPANAQNGPMAAASDGSLWMSTAATTLTRITPAGTTTELPLNIPGPAPSCGAGCKTVVGLAAGPAGTMWFIDGWNHAGQITPAGAATFLPIATDGWQFIGVNMGAGPDGNLWFAPVASGGGDIGRITPAGVVTKFSLSGGSASNITAGTDGGVWFLSWYSGGAFQSPQGRITRITP